MRIAILHDAVEGSAPADSRDALVQAQAVKSALEELGHEVRVMSADLDLKRLCREIGLWRPELAFNLVESLGGKGRLIHLVPYLLDSIRIAYTGAQAEAILVTSNKIMAKERMVAVGLSTPEWVGPDPDHHRETAGRPTRDLWDWIVKSVWEHASIGIDETSILLGKTAAEAFDALGDSAEKLGGACFAERFIDGREFNLSILGGPDGPQVLPPAEIVFTKWAPGKPRIVDYRAKWDSGSEGYRNTPRRFLTGPEDAGLLRRLKTLALACWRGFSLRGYARVDFRVDGRGAPFILEVNANPCLSPDAGFAAALAQAGIPFIEAISRILEDVPVVAESESMTRPFEIRPSHPLQNIRHREQVLPEDARAVEKLVGATGFFSEEEVRIAGELVGECLEKGENSSGYHFIFDILGERIAGYACYGPVPGTEAAVDLYWIAVHPEFQSRGLGIDLLSRVEKRVLAMGRNRVYIETSHREQYKGTRSFYERAGYRLESVLEDFYRPGDAKAIYLKVLSGV